MGVRETPEWYSEWRVTLDIDTVDYGVGGIRLFRSDEVPPGQVGFAIASDGESLVGIGNADWRPEWVVIGYETAGGGPIFASAETPHPVFSAMHGEGAWEPKLVAPSLGVLPLCVGKLRAFAWGRSNPVELSANPPTSEQQAEFLKVIGGLTNGDQDALGFWAVQIELDLAAFNASCHVHSSRKG